MRPLRLFALLTLLVACSEASDRDSNDALDHYALNSASLSQWKLPKRLREISGLELTADGRLLAICDEAAIVYELDYVEGGISKAFALGRPVERGDFEGIAVLDDLVYLVTSSGRLFVTREGADGDSMTFETYETGLRKTCEIEGLAADAQSDSLLIACKEKKRKDDKLSVFAWSPSTKSVMAEKTIALPEKEIAKRLDKKRISPSGIAVEPATGNLFIIAARERAIMELKADGDLIDAIILPLAKRHRQPEGIALTRDGDLLIADEGAGKRAVLSIYEQKE